MKVLLNGQLLEAERAQVSIFDHGFLYGDGIYETVHANGYRLFQWPDHDRRLRESARRIGLKCPWSSERLRRGAERLLRANRAPEGSVRITISRGTGPLGLDPRLCPKPTLAMLLHPARPVEALRKRGFRVGIVQIRRNHPKCLDPQIKSNNSLNTILARREATRLRVDEALLLNLDGYLTEGTTCNLFFLRRGQLCTPALDCGLLRGVTRGLTLRLARRAGIRVREGRFRPEALRAADEAFLSSTTLGLMPVIEVVDDSQGRRRRFQVGSGKPGAVAQALQARLSEV